MRADQGEWAVSSRRSGTGRRWLSFVRRHERGRGGSGSLSPPAIWEGCSTCRRARCMSIDDQMACRLSPHFSAVFRSPARNLGELRPPASPNSPRSRVRGRLADRISGSKPRNAARSMLSSHGPGRRSGMWTTLPHGGLDRPACRTVRCVANDRGATCLLSLHYSVAPRRSARNLDELCTRPGPNSARFRMRRRKAVRVSGTKPRNGGLHGGLNSGWNGGPHAGLRGGLNGGLYGGLRGGLRGGWNGGRAHLLASLCFASPVTPPSC